MRLVVFGRSISSSWANRHATVWRALASGLAELGHEVVFFERDLPYFAAHRDLPVLPRGRLHVYDDWSRVRAHASAALARADAAIVTSLCPDGRAAAELVLASRASVRAFYDLDAPLTLERLSARQWPDYLPVRGLRDFDLVLSLTGGAALDQLRRWLGARDVAPLYGSIEPALHAPIDRVPAFDLSFLGTYCADRQAALDRLLLEAARRRPARAFAVGGALYPGHLPWPANVTYVGQLPASQQSSYFGASRLTLNLARGPMARYGHCPSVRLFEAAACGVPVVSDRWAGIETFFAPGREILLADDVDDVIAAIERSDLAGIAAAARERVLASHTARHRASELVTLLERVGRWSCDATVTGAASLTA
jgi:spore maturation protein CgeB